MIRLSPSLPLLAAALLLTACGGSTSSQNSHDAGSDSPIVSSDAGADQQVDTGPTPDAAQDSAPDAPVDSGLGAACDGQNGAPNGCTSSGLSCYTGGNDPSQAGRWPGGYCTVHCQGDFTCSSFGGVCGGAIFGNGRCLQKCTKPSDCRQGYACRDVGIQSVKMACTPTGFIGTRGPGEACFQHDDPTAANYAPALKNLHFNTSQQVDNSYFSSDEIAFAQNSQDQIVVGANAITQQGYENPALYAQGTTLPLTFAKGSGPQYASASSFSDPYIVAGKDDTFYYSTLGLNNQATQAWLIVAHSADGGKTWQSTKVDPDSDCSGSLGGPNQGPCLDHPWLAIGPDKLDTTKEAVYAAYLATRGSDIATVLIRSTDGGKTWGIPGSPDTSLAVFSASQLNLYTNLITPTVDVNGVVHMVVAAIANEQHGSTQNVIFYSRSEDGGKTRTAPIQISKVGWPVPFEQPVITTDNGNIYVAYVTGYPNADWDIVLATSTDNAKTWTYEKVNDNPDGCATNFHPAIAVDHSTHKVYVAWYDGRFAPYEGQVALTVCDPAAAGPKHCSANEAIGDQPFFITTDRSDLTFLGDYFTLHVKPGGEVWAGFGDTRLGGTSHAFVAKGVVP